MKKELGPLEHFQQAMCAAPPEAGIPLRGLLLRAIELGEDVPALTPAQSEGLPAYALWHAHHDGIERLAGLLPERQGRACWQSIPCAT